MNSQWASALQHLLASSNFYSLQTFIQNERSQFHIYPSDNNVFAALSHTSPSDTRVVIVGQDPYHGAGQAHGLSFSVPKGVALPPSLRNIFSELESDVGISHFDNGDLTGWAEQGVLLLNTTLTVREGEAGSHADKGWEELTDRVIEIMNKQNHRCVFVLWGNHARGKKTLVANPQHVVIENVHPSPLSSYRGFFGSKPFSAINTALIQSGEPPIDWSR